MKYFVRAIFVTNNLTFKNKNQCPFISGKRIKLVGLAYFVLNWAILC